MTMAQKRARTGSALGGARSDSAPGKDEVGRRVRVWWGGDRKWYAGVLARFQQGKHEVAYDDGVRKWYRLRDERWELLRA